MEEALRAVGGVAELPDGETGERFHWIIHIIEGLRDHPDLELRSDGDWSDYDRTPAVQGARRAPAHGAALDLGYARAFEESWPAFLEARERAGEPSLAFQAGIPGDLDMALFVLGPRGALTRRAPFTEATVREIHAMHAQAAGDVVFQIEVPVELVAVARAPAPVRPLLARVLARGIAGLARRSPRRRALRHAPVPRGHEPQGARADARHGAARRARERDRARLAGRPAAGVRARAVRRGGGAAAGRPRWYVPLDRLRLQPGTRFVAGFAHEDQDLADQRFVQELIERSVGAPVDVSTSCGLGRRRPEAAARALARIGELTES